ncbi:YopX family protein [Paenibacillus polymyxa]|uniref:YopX family protein n=1 Tax=Paenibacillus polymyxa TaxID=1406 RepID=UPI000470918A|nr:YopX family protein [Paenibacillus polymyxa]
MRDIKLRAWYKPLGIMVPPDKVTFINFDTKVIGVFMDMDGKGYHVLRLSDFRLMQYTNYYGLEFFDDDLIAVACDCDSEYGCNHGEEIYKVVWDKSMAGYRLKKGDRTVNLDEFGEENMRVVGNIHDNPELLQPQEGNKK